MRGWRWVRDQISTVGRALRRGLGHPDLRSLRSRVEGLEHDLSRSLQREHAELHAAEHEIGVRGDLREYEAGRYSQNGEDGCLLKILSEVGVRSRFLLEIGCGSGIESNSALLLTEFGWSGLLLDASKSEVRAAQDFYSTKEAAERVRVMHESVRPDTVDHLLGSLLGGVEPDVLSIDVDGWDYWLWKSICTISPRVVVMEVNASFGPEVSLTIPWDSSDQLHDPYHSHFRGWHHGASLQAVAILGKSKGYRLIHVEATGTNAFFVREDLATDVFPVLSAEQAWKPHAFRTRRHSPEYQADSLSHTPTVEIYPHGSISETGSDEGR